MVSQPLHAEATGLQFCHFAAAAVTSLLPGLEAALLHVLSHANPSLHKTKFAAPFCSIPAATFLVCKPSSSSLPFYQHCTRVIPLFPSATAGMNQVL